MKAAQGLVGGGEPARDVRLVGRLGAGVLLQRVKVGSELDRRQPLVSDPGHRARCCQPTVVLLIVTGGAEEHGAHVVRIVQLADPANLIIYLRLPYNKPTDINGHPGYKI